MTTSSAEMHRWSAAMAATTSAAAMAATTAAAGLRQREC